MALIDRLLALRGPLHGGGINHEGEAFTATLAIDPLVGGRAAMLHYTALGPDGTPVHTEATLLALAPDGTLTYAHAWGLPGEDVDDRSSARLTPKDRRCA